jgi:hypothetical protein
MMCFLLQARGQDRATLSSSSPEFGPTFAVLASNGYCDFPNTVYDLRILE